MAAPKIKLTPKQTQILAGGIVLLGAGGFLYYRYFWAPVSERIATAKASIEEVVGKINKAKAQAARLPQIERELVVLYQQAADAERRLPKNKDIPAIIDTVAALARKSKVGLISFIPSGATPKNYFIEVPYAIQAKATFHDLGRFFAAIALEERIFNVRNVTFGAAADGVITVNFQLISYQYKG